MPNITTNNAITYTNFIPSGEKANADTNHKILRIKLPFMMSCNC